MHTGMASTALIAAFLQVTATPTVTEVAARFLRKPGVCDGGHFEAPAGPGFGIEFDEAALRACQG